MHHTSTIQWHQQVLNRVEQYLDEHYTYAFGIPQLAEQVHVSYHHLSDIFLQYRGQTLGNYLTRKKLERAAMLCAYTPLNLSAIADQTGYATKHSLAKAFNQHFGASPGSFVKASLYNRQSPNIIHDEIASAEHYLTVLQTDIPFPYKIVTLEHCYLQGRLYAGFDPAADVIPADEGNYFLKAFDSVNFSPVNAFRMFAGRFHSNIFSTESVTQLQALSPGLLLLPVKAGRYVVFDLPPCTILERQRYITICREQLVRRQQLFTPHDFFDFFLFSKKGVDQSGAYYLLISTILKP